jgi:hypothetical protein
MNAWVQVDPCPGSGVAPSGGANVFMETLTVTRPNTLSLLSHIPDLDFFMLTINGQVFQPVGTPPPFTVSGQVIAWASSVFGVNPGDVVVASYSY